MPWPRLVRLAAADVAPPNQHVGLQELKHSLVA